MNNKYFEDIGYKNSCTENLLYKMQNDKRNDLWAKQREICGGYDERATWNLNTFMVEQIFTWLQMYLENADGFVDLTFYKFTIDGAELTEKECVLRILSDFEFYLINQNSLESDTENQCRAKVQDAFQIIGIIFPALWW